MTSTIYVGILKFFKTIIIIIRPWQAGVLKKEITCVNGSCHFEIFAFNVFMMCVYVYLLFLTCRRYDVIDHAGTVCDVN